MKEGDVIPVEELQRLSILFAYPDELPGGQADAARAKEADGVRLKNLQAEYVRLFINSLPEVPCPPYGSFYIEGSLMGESTVRLRKLHLSYGLLTDEMPDHIAVELELLMLLGALSGKDSDMHRDYEFVLGHLRHWVPCFLDRVEENDESGFYRDLSRWARKVLCVET